MVVGSPAVAGDFDLERTTWLMREAGSGTRETCEALLASLDVAPPTLTLGSNGAVVAGAAAGLGVTLVSRDAVRGLLAAGELVEVPVPQTPMRRPWHAVTYPRATAATEVLVVHLLAQEGPPENRWRLPAQRRGPGARPAGKRRWGAPAEPGLARFWPGAFLAWRVSGRASRWHEPELLLL